MNIVAASLCSTLRAPYLTVEQLEEPSLFREQVEISKVVCFSMDLCLFPCGVGEDLAEEIAEFILVILILGVDLYAELRNGQICLFLPLHNPNIIEYRRLQTILSWIHFFSSQLLPHIYLLWNHLATHSTFFSLSAVFFQR